MNEYFCNFANAILNLCIKYTIFLCNRIARNCRRHTLKVVIVVVVVYCSPVEDSLLEWAVGMYSMSAHIYHKNLENIIT